MVLQIFLDLNVLLLFLGCDGREDVPSQFSWFFNVVAGGGSPWEKPGSACTHMTGLWYMFPGTCTTVVGAHLKV